VFWSGAGFSDILCYPRFDSVGADCLDGPFTVAVLGNVVESRCLGFESEVVRTCSIFVLFGVRMPGTASEMR
jgi:hypothetical protein